MLKKLAIIIVFVLVVASVAGCTSKGVEITAHQSGTKSLVLEDGTVYLVTGSVTAKITNNGPGNFYISNITFYQNDTKDDARMIQYPTKDGVAIKYVKPGETLEIVFASFRSGAPDTLQYNDGISEKTVAIQKS
jgi:hypothetical protein